MCDDFIDIKYMPIPPKYVYLLCSRSSFRSSTYKVLSIYDDESQCMEVLFEKDTKQDGTLFYIKQELFYSCPF